MKVFFPIVYGLLFPLFFWKRRKKLNFSLISINPGIRVEFPMTNMRRTELTPKFYYFHEKPSNSTVSDGETQIFH